MKSPLLFVSSLALCFVATACMSASKKYADHPEYQQGYGEGCASGSSYGRDLPGSVIRDAQLYQTNEAYAAGWRAGFNACRPGLADPLGN